MLQSRVLKIPEQESEKHSMSTLTHLKRLEAESIHIIREVVAEFENPVMLYSIGKDTSVMVRLAEKAFYPGQAAVSADARGYDVEVPGNVRAAREHVTESWG